MTGLDDTHIPQINTRINENLNQYSAHRNDFHLFLPATRFSLLAAQTDPWATKTASGREECA